MREIFYINKGQKCEKTIFFAKEASIRAYCNEKKLPFTMITKIVNPRFQGAKYTGSKILKGDTVGCVIPDIVGGVMGEDYDTKASKLTTSIKKY